MHTLKVGEEAGFRIAQHMKPQGDQPEAIEQLTEGILAGEKFQTRDGEMVDVC
jgi:excinuclease UvrABC helicase subunit UvrB